MACESACAVCRDDAARVSRTGAGTGETEDAVGVREGRGVRDKLFSRSRNLHRPGPSH